MLCCSACKRNKHKSFSSSRTLSRCSRACAQAPRCARRAQGAAACPTDGRGRQFDRAEAPRRHRGHVWESYDEFPHQQAIGSPFQPAARPQPAPSPAPLRGPAGLCDDALSCTGWKSRRLSVASGVQRRLVDVCAMHCRLAPQCGLVPIYLPGVCAPRRRIGLRTRPRRPVPLQRGN